MKSQAAKGKVEKKYIVSAIVFVIALILELFISNDFAYLFSNAEREEVDLSLANVKKSSNGILMTGESNEVEFDLKNGVKTYYVTLEFEGDREYVTGNIKIKDESRENTYATLNEFSFNPVSGKDVVVPLKSSGEVKNIKISVNAGSHSSVTLKKVVLNDNLGVRFNALRFILMIIIAFLVYYVSKKPIFKECFNSENKNHLKFAAAAVVFNLCISAFIFGCTNTESTKYPFEGNIDNYDILLREFDAVKNGRTYMETNISDEEMERLASLENPYDRSQRDSNVKYLWDYAYYNGKYYSYFGLAPIIVFYFPYYFATGSLPSPATAAWFFAETAILFMALSLLEAVRAFKLKTKLINVFLALLALPSATLLFMIQSSADKYYVTYTAAYAFLSLFVFFTLKAYENRRKVSGVVFCALSAFSVVLTVASRPTTLIAVFFMMLPLYLHILCEKDNEFKQKAKLVTAFSVPLILGAAVIMAYNYVRFDSPFEFGATYQLTVSDISYNSVSLSASDIFSYIVHYWFRFLKLTETFPFVAFESVSAFGNGGYIWNSYPHMGMMAIPLNLMLFALPFSLSEKETYKKAMMIAGVLSSVVILYVNYCVGGIIIRYICDALFATVPIAIVLTWQIADSASAKGVIVLERACRAIFVLSIILGYALIFINERSYISSRSPEVYMLVKNLFTFG
jgi:hypothetical protein